MNQVKCIFNFRTCNYELRYFSISNDKERINLFSLFDYPNSDYMKWKSIVDIHDTIKMNNNTTKDNTTKQ